MKSGNRQIDSYRANKQRVTYMLLFPVMSSENIIDEDVFVELLYFLKMHFAFQIETI